MLSSKAGVDDLMLLLHETPISASILGFVLLLLASGFLNNYLTSPLKNLPGPWHTKFTEAILKWYTLTGKRLHYIHTLHQTYGSVVQISPTEVSITDQKTFQEIHKIGGGFLKDPWYRKFRQGDDSGSIDVFSAIDPRVHGAKRKVLARPFSNTALRQNWEDMIIGKVKTTISQIKHEIRSTGKADVFKWWTFFTSDAIGMVAFGEDFEMVETGIKPAFVTELDNVMMLSGIRAELPWLYKLFCGLSLNLYDPVKGMDLRLRSHSRQIMSNLRDRKLGKGNVFFGIQATSEADSTPHSVDYAAYEGQSLIIAGSGTTAVTLTYLVWAVLKRPDVQKKLEAELHTLPTKYRDADLETLPYLNAVIRETLRLYGAAPGSLPRRNDSNSFAVNGHHIAPGATVSTQAWTIHRDPNIFDAPEQYRPERFLNPSPEMNAAMSPFGAGSRTCLGINLAYMELRHATAHFFRNCAGAKLAPTTTDEVMAVQHFFLIAPKGGKCDITL